MGNLMGVIAKSGARRIAGEYADFGNGASAS
jgi:hypothetical protein